MKKNKRNENEEENYNLDRIFRYNTATTMGYGAVMTEYSNLINTLEQDSAQIRSKFTNYVLKYDEEQSKLKNKIDELEQANEQLKEENRRLDEYVSCTMSATEFDEEIKRAKIDVLNELWEKVKDKGVDYKIGMRALGEEFDELIKEIEK